MSASGVPSLDPSDIAREVLSGSGSLPFSWLLEHAVPLKELREIARIHDIAIKGYRQGSAPAGKLAAAIAKADAEIVEKACAALVAASSQGADKAAAPAKPTESVSTAVHRVVEQARDAATQKASKLEAQVAPLRTQVDTLRRELQLARDEATRLRSSEQRLRSEVGSLSSELQPEDRSAGLRQTIHELERDLETYGEADAGLRRLLALRETRLRDAEAQIAELEALVPKGKRRRKQPRAEVDPERRFFVPRFELSFYRSLDGKERVSVERAFRAVFSLCTEGPAYPGLEVKQIEGQDLWSCRASLKLRVYFRMPGDGQVQILELADREDQNTALRRLKER